MNDIICTFKVFQGKFKGQTVYANHSDVISAIQTLSETLECWDDKHRYIMLRNNLRRIDTNTAPISNPSIWHTGVKGVYFGDNDKSIYMTYKCPYCNYTTSAPTSRCPICNVLMYVNLDMYTTTI